MQERLQKILARANYGSRRSCEDLIATGRVTVNGRLVKLGMKADVKLDIIEVDGQQIDIQNMRLCLDSFQFLCYGLYSICNRILKFETKLENLVR